MYMQGYAAAAEKRHLGFRVQGLAAAVLWVAALIGVAKALLNAYM
jgi:hypothetical protein